MLAEDDDTMIYSLQMVSFDIWIFGCLDIWMVINSLKIVIIDMARYTARFWIFENLVIPVIPEIPVIPVIPIMYDKSTISEL